MKALKLASAALFGAAVALAGTSMASAQEFTFKLHHLLGAKAPAQTQML